MEFRLLAASEIECRVAQVKANGLSLLLYKDARVDQNILDETVGAMNWQRSHSRDNANCTVSIWDEDKKMWVSKEDTGKESFSEAEKGLASDSFKRACFNWGIGRELYTAPFIWISSDKVKIDNENGKPKCYERFKVSKIGYDEKKNINQLEIVNGRDATVYSFGTKVPKKSIAVEEAELKAKVLAYINRHNMPIADVQKLCGYYKIQNPSQLTIDNCKDYIAKLEKKGKSIDE